MLAIVFVLVATATTPLLVSGGKNARGSESDVHALARPSSVNNSVDVFSLPLLSSAGERGHLLGGPSSPVVDGVALAAEGTFGADTLLSEVPVSDRIALYIVREGDTLSQIAKMFGVSVNTIRWANNLRSADLIKPGQELLILPVSGVRYTVREGDTLASIAKKLHGDVEEIITYNGLREGEPLRPGMALIVPGGELPDTPHNRRQAPYRPTRRVAVGYFINPLPQGVRTQGLHGWNAVDLAAPIGTPILAAASGEVIVARASGWNGGYGSYIVLRHNNGTQTLYAHLSRLVVYVGQKVVQGQVIGYVGSTGRSTGPHLHFEVRGAANPFAY